jgi:hypothetical protein
MIDEEIRKTLDVDPSPDFLARVRTRIAAEPAPSTWRWSWGLAAGCALTASVVLATIVSRPHDAKSTTNVAQAPHAIAGNNTPPAVSPARGDAGPRQTHAVAPHMKSVAPRAPELEPEILIDQREMETLRGLIAGVRNGRIDLTAAQNSTSRAPAQLEPVADIVIAPLTIEPIAPVPGAEGVRP